MSKMPVTYLPKGRRRGWDLWDDEKLAKLRALCEQQASWDDLNAAFPTYGMSTVLFGMRTIIYNDARRAQSIKAGLVA